ncbi:MAG: DedA family protein [Caulobacteraceae bacterium]|nr:YqaA family protein [Caulobacter sp.]RYF89802.1 MAG: DedA family protein [Caulobacteraceae bacterium]
MLRKLYDWVMGLAGSKHAPSALFAVSFAEASFFPIPPDVMLAPMVLKRPDRAWFYAFVCTLASVLGGIAGYAIGYYLQDLGRWLLSLGGHAGDLDSFQCWVREYGAWVVLIKGLTPIPFKLVTIAMGMGKLSLPIFILTATLTRAARFFLVAGVVKIAGPAMLPVIEKRLGLVALGVIVLIVAGFVIAHFLGGGAPAAC